jgi:hypothetical protein
VARISFIVASLFAGASLLLASVAQAAGGTSVGAYGGTAGQTQGAIHSAAQQSALGQTSGTLPFTGLNLSLIVAAGVLLLLTGVVLRRRSGRASNDS